MIVVPATRVVRWLTDGLHSNFVFLESDEELQSQKANFQATQTEHQRALTSVRVFPVCDPRSWLLQIFFGVFHDSPNWLEHVSGFLFLE